MTLLHYRILLVTLLTLLHIDAGHSSVRLAPAPSNDGLEVSTPANAHFDLSRLSAGFDKAAKLPYSHSLLVLKDGKLVAEGYFNGHHADSPNNLKSVTKSVMSILIGIALDRKLLKSIDLPVITFLPELAVEIDDPRKSEITIRHLLTMSAGFDANDDLADLNCSAHLDSAKCVFARPIIHEPGKTFSYTSAYVDTLSRVLSKIAHMPTRAFAEKYLFGPMGIKVLGWSRNALGYYLGESELFLTSRDMVKLGWLVLNHGRYKSKQILSKEWIVNSTSPKITASKGNGEYGYLWWMKSKEKTPFVYAWGYGGQYIYIVPAKKMVVVMTNDFNQGRPQGEIRSIIVEHIIAAARD